jgi:hypothetical protein
MRSHAAAPGKGGAGDKENAKGDAKNGKPFHAWPPSTGDQLVNAFSSCRFDLNPLTSLN